MRALRTRRTADTPEPKNGLYRLTSHAYGLTPFAAISPGSPFSPTATLRAHTYTPKTASKMQEKKTETTAKAPKKANLLDHHSIKHILDESVSEIVTSRGYVEDVRMSNIRLFMGTIIIVIALVAQFYKKKFPENRDFLIGCILLYIVFNMLLQLIIHTKEKNAILFTYPPAGSFTSTGLVVSSKLPRFSDLYTLSIASADPNSISAGKPVELTKSVTQWFTKDGVLVEGLLWKDVEALTDSYAGEDPKKK